jgi:hypothetical protein
MQFITGAKIKLSLIRGHAMKTYSYTSALDAGEWLASRSGHFAPQGTVTGKEAGWTLEWT